jgi:type I restriction enzyme, R subunit
MVPFSLSLVSRTAAAVSYQHISPFSGSVNPRPESLLFNNLASIAATTFQCPEDDTEKAAIALKLDQAMRDRAPAGWKGDETREKQVLNAIFPIMSRDRDATQAIFEIIKNQGGY